MNFEDMQVIWDAQKKEELFAINREALQRLVSRDAIAVQRDLKGLELGAIATCLGLACVTVIDTFFNGDEYFQLVSATVQVCAAGWLWMRRRQREAALDSKPENLVHRVENAIQRATATIQRGRDLSWFFSVLILYGLGIRFLIYGWRGSEAKTLLAVVGVTLVHFAFRLVERQTHSPRRQNLQALQTKLTELE